MTPGQQTIPKNFRYGALVSIPDTTSGDQSCYCVDQNILETIASLPAKNLSGWCFDPKNGIARRGSLIIWKIDYGYFAYRNFRLSPEAVMSTYFVPNPSNRTNCRWVVFS